MSDIRSEGESALNAVRNKIDGYFKKDQSVKVSMYSPVATKRTEGETWTDEDGKQWEMKNGIARSISKLQDAKRPWWCPECGRMMRGKADDRMWEIYSKCHVCVIQEETKRRIDGTWQLYERLKMIDNAISYVQYYLDQFTDLKDGLSNPKNYFIDGRWEEWKIGIGEIKEDVEHEIGRFEERLTELRGIRDEVTRLLEERESAS